MSVAATARHAAARDDRAHGEAPAQPRGPAPPMTTGVVNRVDPAPARISPYTTTIAAKPSGGGTSSPAGQRGQDG